MRPGKRYLLALQAARITRSVPALVMGVDGVGHVLQIRHAVNNEVAQHDVVAHDAHLFFGQSAGLLKDVVRHADLADVVKQSADAQGVHRPVGKTHPLAQRDGVLRVLLRVASRVAVLAIDGPHERVEHSERRPLPADRRRPDHRER